MFPGTRLFQGHTGARMRVVRKARAVWQYRLHLELKNISCAVVWWKATARGSGSLCALSSGSTWNRWSAAGEVAVVIMCSGNSLRILSRYCCMAIRTFPFSVKSISMPNEVWTRPLLTVRPGYKLSSKQRIFVTSNMSTCEILKSSMCHTIVIWLLLMSLLATHGL